MKNAIYVFYFIFFGISSIYSQTDSVKYEMTPIIVTAARISSTWLEVPLALNVIEVKELRQIRGYGIDEALSSVPGVMAQSRYGNQDVRLTIRGFGARGAGERSNAGTSRGIRVLIDGIPETEPDGRTSFDLIEMSAISRVEVIRSNASALWGNASGGVVNFVSNYSFEKPFIILQSNYGSFGYRKELINVGTNIGSGKYFMTLSNTNFDGWRENSASTRALLNTGLVASLDDHTSLGVYLAAASNLFRIPGPLTQKQFNENPRQAQNDTSNYKPTYVQRQERRFNRLGRIAAKLSHELDYKNNINVAVFLNQKFLQRSERNTFRDFTRYHVGGNIIYQNSLILDRNLKNILLLGIDEAYQDGAILFYNLVNGQRGSTLTTNKREGANNFGIFIQDELTIQENLSLIAGLRYDNVTYYSDNFMKPHLKAAKSFKQLTPKAGITYFINPTHTLFANLGGGVEVPAANEVDPPNTFGQDTVTSLNPLLEPVRSTTLEIGTKQVLYFDNMNYIKNITYDAALYWINVRNEIIPYRDGRFYFTAGKTRRVGFEFGFSLKTDFGISLRSSVTYMNCKYVEYIVDSVHYNKPGRFNDLRDKKVAGVPQIFYGSSIRYNLPLLNDLFGEINNYGVGKYYADDNNLYVVPAYNIVNFTFGFENLKFFSDKIEVKGSVGINNLFDKSYAASAFINPDVDRIYKIYPIYLEPGMPRNYVGSISISF